MRIDEIWRPIPWATRYKVSNLGRIIGARGWVLRPAADLHGYLQVLIYVDGEPVGRKLHQIVCEVFHGPRPSKAHGVAHRNGNKLDNAETNLRWATMQENRADDLVNGTRRMRDTHPRATITSEKVEALRRECAAVRRGRQRAPRGWRPEAAKRYGITLKDILTRRSWA